MVSAERATKAATPESGGAPERSPCERGRAPVHVPVLPDEVLHALGGERPAEREGWIVDATCGAGGHAGLILARMPRVSLLGLDQDPCALAEARRSLAPYGERVRLRHGRLSQLARRVRKERIGRPVGVLLDLGVCSLHLDRPERGFSFQDDGPLDMRMDPTRERTAADVVNTWDEGDLADLLFYEGDEARARKIARALVEARRRAPFLRTAALADAVAQAVGRGGGRIHPATRTFQALRRAVNEEGEELRSGLASAEHWLADGGRLAVISFHSGEDREVKRFLAGGARAGRWETLTKKPVAPGPEERRANRRARSARLRAAERRRAWGTP